jgi:hypothetical protein
MNTFENLNDAVVALKEKMIEDYREFNMRSAEREDCGLDRSWFEERVEAFADSFRIEEGRTYIKLVADRSVRGFVVKKPTKGFVVGDMLMAASYKAPATNFARGNALMGEFDRVRWTGIL